MSTTAATNVNEAEQARDEMHLRLDELDAAKKAHATGSGTIEQVEVATEKAYEATERYLDAVREAKAPIARRA
jgi:hypothetical protein